jgi:hypothetical protein
MRRVSVASKPGQLTIERIADCACCGVMCVGRPWVWPRTTARPRRKSTRRQRNRSAWRLSHLVAWRLARSHNGVFPRHSPAGASRVTEAGGHLAASSSATQPPREFPTRCGDRTPSWSSCTATAPARAAGLGSTEAGRGLESPNPGRSMAMTSKLRRQGRDDRVKGVSRRTECVKQHNRCTAATSCERKL